MFPNSDDRPARLAQPHIRISVALDVGVDLGTPPCGIGFRAGAVDTATMPEASVDEDRDAR